METQKERAKAGLTRARERAQRLGQPMRPAKKASLPTKKRLLDETKRGREVAAQKPGEGGASAISRLVQLAADASARVKQAATRSKPPATCQPDSECCKRHPKAAGCAVPAEAPPRHSSGRRRHTTVFDVG